MSVDTMKFKTKTYFEKATNIAANDAWVVGMDIGYSAVKIMSHNGAFCFPSFAMSRPEEDMTVGVPQPTDIQYKDPVDGIVWDVGDVAISRLQQNDSNNTEEVLYSRNRYNSPMFKILVRVGIALGINGCNSRRLVIQTGLPPAYLKTDAPLIKGVIEGKHEFYLKFGGKNEWKKYEFVIHSDNIKVMGQPMGSLFSATFDDKGKELPGTADFLSSNVLIFDGGFGTLDTFEIRNRTISAMQTFDHLGMKAVLHKASKIIYNNYGEDISVSAMQNNLASGYFTKYDPKTVSTKNIPIGDIIEQASKEVCAEAIMRIKQIYNNLVDYKYLLVTGGTGDAWFEQIKTHFSKMETLEVIPANRNANIKQVFANVRGYYLFAVNAINSQT